MSVIKSELIKNSYSDYSLRIAKYELSRLCPVRDFDWTIDETNYRYTAHRVPLVLLGIFKWIKDTVLHLRKEKMVFRSFQHQYQKRKLLYINSSVIPRDVILECLSSYDPCKSPVPRIRSALSAIYTLSQKYEWVPEAIWIDARNESRVTFLMLIPDHFQIEPYLDIV